MDFHEPRILGRTGLRVGRLGVAGGYGAPAAAFEEAFERGCNYFYWGSLRRAGMAQAIKNLCGRGKREVLVIVIQSYARFPALMKIFGERALKSLNIQAADVLLLGWHNQRAAAPIIEGALTLKEAGEVPVPGHFGPQSEVVPGIGPGGYLRCFSPALQRRPSGRGDGSLPRLTGNASRGAARTGDLYRYPLGATAEEQAHASRGAGANCGGLLPLRPIPSGGGRVYDRTEGPGPDAGGPPGSGPWTLE